MIPARAGSAPGRRRTVRAVPLGRDQVGGDHRLGPGHHGAVEHLHPRDVRRRQVQHPLARTTEPLLGRQRRGAHRVAGEHHPLRLAGRARGGDHQRLGVGGRVPLAQQARGSPRPCRRRDAGCSRRPPTTERRATTVPADGAAPPMTTMPVSGSPAPVRAPCPPRSPRCWPGPAIALWEREAVWWKALLALAVSLLLQVGVNYANDYSDGMRGTDDDRVGPLRLVGSGVASPRAVKTAAFMAFGARRGGRAGPRRDHGVVAGRGRAAVHPRGVVLHRREEALRLPRAGRGDGLRVLRAGRRARHDVRPDRELRAPCAVRRRRCRCVRLRDPRGQQPARHPHRHASSGKRTLAVVLGEDRTRHLYGLLIDATLVALVGVALSTTCWA